MIFLCPACNYDRAKRGTGTRSRRRSLSTKDEMRNDLTRGGGLTVFGDYTRSGGSTIESMSDNASEGGVAKPLKST